MALTSVQININNAGYVDMTYDAETDEYVYSFPLTLELVQSIWTGSWQTSIPSIIKASSSTETTTKDYRINFQLDLDFIYDRTYSDLQRALYLNTQVNAGTATQREYAQWLTDLKGALNRSDLVRNCTNIYILSLFTGNEIDMGSIPELPMPEYYIQFLQWVQDIRDSGYVLNTTPEVPVRPLNTFQKWNDIERILYDVFNIINDLRDAIWYCGDDAYAGGDIAVL